MSEFINRDRELAFLERCYAAGGFQFVPIYGRRRIGKTELVKQFLKDKAGIYYLADAMDEKSQLSQLGECVGEFFDDLVLREQGFKEWYSFFKYLSARCVGLQEKLLVIIDEFPYLARANSAISSVFQKGIDEYLKEANIFLVILGSQVGMMEKEVLHYKAPLYGRRTGSLKLEEMSFFELKDFFPGKERSEWVDIYTVCGVVPGYLDKYGQDESFDDFLLRGVFNKGGFFYEEAEMVLREDFYEPGTYYAILKTIALGRHRLSEIMTETGLEKSKISKYLKVLQDLLIVEREVPVTEKHHEKSRRGLFFIRDKYLNFWFRFILGNKNHIEIGRFEQIFARVRRQITDYQGSLFEDICKQYLLQHVDRYEFNTIGRWWDRQDEIDLLAIDEEQDRFIAAECKYRSRETGLGTLEELKAKIEKIKWHKPFEVKKIILFSKAPFTPALKAKTKEDDRLELVAFADMQI